MIGDWIAPTMVGLLELALDASPRDLIDRLVQLRASVELLDFGCGSGPHRGDLTAAGFNWHGVDYAQSDDRAALARSFTDGVTLYDGFTLPFAASTFDVVWACQSFEHVLDAEKSARECARVLRPGGYFAGSVSFLEPSHARSTFCYTPYGFHHLCKRHGLDTIKIYVIAHEVGWAWARSQALGWI